MNPFQEQKPLSSNRIHAAMSMSSISTVPTPSTSHSQIFEDARQGKFRANQPSDGVTKRNPYEFEDSDSEGEQLMAAPSHGPLVKDSNVNLHDRFPSGVNQGPITKGTLSKASLEQLGDRNPQSLADRHAQLEKMENDRLAFRGYTSGSSSASSENGGVSIGVQPTPMLPTSSTYSTAKAGNNKSSLKEFLQGESSSPTGYIPSAQRGMEKPSAGYEAFLGNSGMLRASNSGLALKHPIMPIAESAGKSPPYNPPVLHRNQSYDSYPHLVKPSASASFPPYGVQCTTPQGNTSNNSFPTHSYPSPAFEGRSMNSNDTSTDTDVTADLLSSPIKEMQKNLRAAATSSRIPRPSEIYQSRSANPGKLIEIPDHTPSAMKERSSGYTSDVEDFDRSFGSLGLREEIPKESGQLSHQGKTANDAIRERTESLNPRSQYGYPPFYGNHKNGESSSGGVRSKKEGCRDLATDDVISRSRTPVDDSFASSNLPVEDGELFRSTPSGSQAECERHADSRALAEPGTEDKSEELRKSSSRFGFGVLRNIKEKHDAKKAKKAEDKGKGKEKMEHDPVDDPLDIEVLPLSKMLEQAFDNLAALKAMHAKVNEETACCGGITRPVDFEKIETRINGLQLFYDLYLKDYVESGEAADDHREAMRAARDAGSEDYMNPEVYEEHFFTIKGQASTFQASLQKRVKDFAVVAKNASKNHKAAHIMAEAAFKAGNDSGNASAHPTDL